MIKKVMLPLLLLAALVLAYEYHKDALKRGLATILVEQLRARAGLELSLGYYSLDAYPHRLTLERVRLRGPTFDLEIPRLSLTFSWGRLFAKVVEFDSLLV